MSTQYLDVSSPGVVSMPIRECGEKLVSVEGFIEYGAPPESSGTVSFYRLLRKSVLKKLLRAQAHLPHGCKFRLYEGYRSSTFQAELFQQQVRRIRLNHSALSESACYKKAALLVAPVKSLAGKPLSPPHCTGGAIDIDIVDPFGKVLDFAMDIKDWFSVEAEVCASDFDGVSKQAKYNREMLVTVLSDEGFVNYPREWWHFSYGDQYWALVKKRPYALYGCVQL